MFDAEVAGLRRLIMNCGIFCSRHGYDDEAARSFVEGRCRSYAEILVPVIAARRELYDLLVKEQPSLAPFLSEKVAQHFATIPSEKVIERELATVLADMNAKGFGTGSFNIADVSTVQIMLNKYGFAQELMLAMRRVKPELFATLLQLYDMRLTAAQTVADPDQPEDR